MLIGHLADALAEADVLIRALRLQSNASATTRSRLDHLLDLTGNLWTMLRAVENEARSLRSESGGR